MARPSQNQSLYVDGCKNYSTQTLTQTILMAKNFLETKKNLPRKDIQKSIKYDTAKVFGGSNRVQRSAEYLFDRRKTRSFHKAAEKLYITPPAVVKQVNQILSNLGEAVDLVVGYYDENYLRRWKCRALRRETGDDRLPPHLHYDHAGKIEYFKNAKVAVQKRGQGCQILFPVFGGEMATAKIQTVKG